MAVNVGAAYIELKARVEDLEKDLARARSDVEKSTQAMSKSSEKASKAFKAMWVAAAAGAAVAIAAMYKAVKAANEQELAEKKLEAVVRSTGMAAGYTAEQLKEMAAGFQKVTEFGDETVISGLAILSTFKQIKGEAFEETMQAALDMSVVMGQDLRSSVVQLGKALNDPVANLGALSRTGVQFTEKQKEVIKGLWQTGRQAEAQAIILEELQSQFGGAATAATQTFGGAMKQMSNTLGDAFEAMGYGITKNEELIDVVHRLTQGIRNLIDEGTLAEWASAVGRAVAGAARMVADAVGFFQRLFNLTPEERLKDVNEQIAHQEWLMRQEISTLWSTAKQMQIFSERQSKMNELIQERIRLQKILGLLPPLEPKAPAGAATGGGAAGAETAARYAALKDEEERLNEEVMLHTNMLLMKLQAEKDYQDQVAGLRDEARQLETERRQEEMEQYLAHQIQKQTALTQHHTTMAEMLDMFRAADTSSYAAQQSAQLDLLQDKLDKEQISQEQYEKAISAMKVSAAKSQLHTMSQTFLMMSQQSKKYGKEMFRLYQATAIAEATIAGISAAVHAWDWGMKLGGPVLAGIFAAISVAYTAAQIAAIASQSPPTSPPAATASAGAAGASQVPGADLVPPGGEQQGQMTIYIQGDLLADEYYIELLAEKISEAAENKEVRVVASEVRETE